MRELIPQIDSWLSQGKQVGLATVVQTWGSSPREVGSRMAFNAEGKMTGSVSGGCVEGAVLQSGLEALQSGRGKLLYFGVSDESAWEVGLACGGEIQVIVSPLNLALYNPLREALQQESSVVEAIALQGDERAVGKSVLVATDGSIVGGDLEGDVTALTLQGVRALERQAPGIFSSGPEGMAQASNSFFLLPHLPSPELVLIGGVHIGIALSQIAQLLGYQVTLIDPRRAFATKDRFPHVDRLIQGWPGEAFQEISLKPTSAVAALTHDPKIDDPALVIALNSAAFYVGALGSKKTQTERRERLLDLGLSPGQLSRLHGPIGLDLGARSPEEIALAIMAEILETRKNLAG
jgi:xanthine dehydrogenase accessory factor